MKKFATFIWILAAAQLQAQTISSTEFYQKTKDTAAILLDVRSPEEYSSSHLPDAVNINWNDSLFKQKTDLLNKNKPLLVYCLSGGRSAKAASALRLQGYQVYELQGGLLQWRAAHLPEAPAATSTINDEMTLAAFDSITSNRSQKVLVDFYADWCAPCKEMESYLQQIAGSRNGTLKLVRINVDKNPTLAQALKITAIPVLLLYENNRLKWQHTGYANKKTVLKQL